MGAESPTIDAGSTIPASTRRCTAEVRALADGDCGHNLSFPSGASLRTPNTSGLTFHGETALCGGSGPGAARIRWWCLPILPDSNTRFTRSVLVEGQIAYFGVRREPERWDRPVGWCEHVTSVRRFSRKANHHRCFVDARPGEWGLLRSRVRVAGREWPRRRSICVARAHCAIGNS